MVVSSCLGSQRCRRSEESDTAPAQMGILAQAGKESGSVVMEKDVEKLLDVGVHV